MANATPPARGLVVSPEDALPVAPTAEEWRAMSPDERLHFEVAANEALSASAALMGEGEIHHDAKRRAFDALSLHFRTIGRSVYLAEELAVHYPGEKVFAPDVFAVLDVVQPKLKRLAWKVAVEGKGPEFILEVLHYGDRKKDLVKNVATYARLHIQEYFVYDALRQEIHGWHLPGPEASSYQHKVAERGHYRSEVLGVDLAIIGDTLQFLVGEATLPVSADLIDRLHGIRENLETKVKQAQAQVEEAEARGFQEAILALLQARAIPFSDEVRARVQSCTETATLRLWMLRATTAGSFDEVFPADPPATE